MQQQNQLPGHSVPGLNRMAAEEGHDPKPQHAIHNSQGSSVAPSSPMAAIAGPSNFASVLGTGRTLRSHTQAHGAKNPTVLGTHGNNPFGSSMHTKRFSLLLLAFRAFAGQCTVGCEGGRDASAG